MKFLIRIYFVSFCLLRFLKRPLKFIQDFFLLYNVLYEWSLSIIYRCGAQFWKCLRDLYFGWSEGRPRKMFSKKCLQVISRQSNFWRLQKCLKKQLKKDKKEFAVIIFLRQCSAVTLEHRLNCDLKNCLRSNTGCQASPIFL